MKQKIDEEKKLRDWQLMEAKARKQQDFKLQRASEIEFVKKLKQEIEAEKQSHIDKK